MINPKDLRIFSWSSERRGSWYIGVETGVHIIHLPTGLEVKEESCRSQHRNKELAITKLEDMINE